MYRHESEVRTTRSTPATTLRTGTDAADAAVVAVETGGLNSSLGQSLAQQKDAEPRGAAARDDTREWESIDSTRSWHSALASLVAHSSFESGASVPDAHHQ